MAQLEMIDPAGNVCTLSVQDHAVSKFVADKFAAGWKFAPLAPALEDSADEESPDFEVEE